MLCCHIKSLVSGNNELYTVNDYITHVYYIKYCNIKYEYIK